ncbi:MAG: TIGR03435 family protein [Acidobacteriaceae bacterium]|nr:TIGR03435 family protein [Acidobacteriaceae bacterium]
MKKLITRAFALATLGASVLSAQTFTGTWQGALKAPQAPKGELRVVIKINTTETDKLAAQLYSIDQGAPPISSDTVTASGSNLRMTFAQLNGTYEGKLSPDGKTITGTWTQGMPVPLTLSRATPETAWSIPEPPPPPKMMDPNAKPEFEVATIKPSDPNRRGLGITVNRSGMLNTLNTTLFDLIKFAYDVHPKQIVGAPAWCDSDKFDISAKPDTPGMPTVKQLQMMLQKLLADRFSLQFHHEKKELSAYAITVAKGGEKIKKEPNANVPIPGFGGQPQRGFLIRNATMSEFASVMQAQFMDQPVVDQTGFGNTRYSFTLRFTPDPAMRPFGAAPNPEAQTPPPDQDAPPDLFGAMEQQLGLRMQKTKAPVDVMVIDSVEKPSAN